MQIRFATALEKKLKHGGLSPSALTIQWLEVPSVSGEETLQGSAIAFSGVYQYF